MSGQLKVSLSVPVEGWVQGDCECGWNSGKVVSGGRAKMALLEHLGYEHGLRIDPRVIQVPPGAPE